jgi:hypothetical protein
MKLIYLFSLHLFGIPCYSGAMRDSSWLRHYARSRKNTGSIPVDNIGIGI